MTFRVGQKVVCVNDTYLDRNWAYIPNRPVRGGVYTVREVLPAWLPDGTAAIHLYEIANPAAGWRGQDQPTEGAFCIERFKPVTDRKTDISDLKALLVPGARIRERA